MCVFATGDAGRRVARPCDRKLDRSRETQPVESASSMLTFQQLILRLNDFWDRQGCVLLQPTTWRSVQERFIRDLPARHRSRAVESRYVQPSRRPKTGATARIQTGCSTITSTSGAEAIPAEIQESTWIHSSTWGSTRNSTTSASSRTTGNRRRSALGPGLGSLARRMEITQFTYFQEAAGSRASPCSAKSPTPGAPGDVLAGKERVFDLVWTPA